MPSDGTSRSAALWGNGRVVGRVEDAMVTRDAHSMLTGPGAVASGPEWIGVFRGAPRVERTGVPVSMKE